MNEKQKKIIEDMINESNKNGIDLYAMGCKGMLEQLENANSMIDTCIAESDYLWHEYARVYEIVDDSAYAETISRYHEAFNAAMKAEKEAKFVRSAIAAAIRDWRTTAKPEELALYKARCEVRAKKIKDASSLPEGARSYHVLPKIVMKSYKIMKFNPDDLYGRKVKDLANQINALIQKPEGETDDEFRTRCNKIVAKYHELDNYADYLLNNKISYKLSAEKAKINNARQSELTDAIGMIYGKTTDMMITIKHDIASLFSEGVASFLARGDRDKGMEMLNDLQAKFAAVFVDNGCDLKLLGKDSRVIHFDFWTANNSQLKVGEAWMLSEDSYKIAKHAGQMGMSDEEYNKIATNGSNILKYWSYASTPGCPMKDYDGNIVTIDDVLVLPSMDIFKKFKHVLEVMKDGTTKVHKELEIGRTFADGMAILFNIPSQQFRGLLSMKGFGTCVAIKNVGHMVYEIAQREGLTIPKLVKDIDNNLQDWTKFKVITSADSWKWAGLGVSWENFKARMKEIAKTTPGADLMYTARLADSIEEDDRRKMARQTTQQLANATAEQISKLIANDASKLKNLTTLPGVLKKFAGLNKDEKDRTAFEHLIEVCPSILAHPLMQEKVKQMFDAQFANAAMRPSVHGCYPYLAEDPVAVIKVWIFGMNPDQNGLGYLKEDEFNVPGLAEGQEFFFVRYPANQLVAMVRKNHNDPIYRMCGNVALLSIDGDTIIRADGDFDGDEGSIVTDKLVVELCKQVETWTLVDGGDTKRPLIKFPHDKAEKYVVEDPHERAMMVARAIVTANRFGGAVGQNSNLATRCFESAASTNNEHARKHHLMNAAWAHIGAIIAIDLAKTGKMPDWLQAQIDRVTEEECSKMPWNQRFAKHTTSNPWWRDNWDVLGESLSTPNRIPRALMNKLDIECEKTVVTEEDEDGNPTAFNVIPAKRIDISFEGLTLDDDILLDRKVKNYATKAVVDLKMIRSIEARNYRTKDEETDGDDEFQIVRDMKAGKVIGMSELFRFIWRNRASLVYKTMNGAGGKDLDNAQMVNGYYEWCHDLMLKFGQHGTTELFTRMSSEDQAKAIANKFIKAALTGKSGVGKDIAAKIAEIEKAKECRLLTSDEKNEIEDLKAELKIRQASFLEFTLKIFAYEYYQTVCDNKDIKNRWVKPVDCPEEVSDDIEIIDELAEEAF